MRPLNDERNAKQGAADRHLAAADGDRREAKRRQDVAPTSDLRAYQEMLAYCRSDPDTLDRHRDSQVAAFYRARCVFITGASGFVGKVSWRNQTTTPSYLT